MVNGDQAVGLIGEYESDLIFDIIIDIATTLYFVSDELIDGGINDTFSSINLNGHVDGKLGCKDEVFVVTTLFLLLDYFVTHHRWRV